MIRRALDWLADRIVAACVRVDDGICELGDES